MRIWIFLAIFASAFASEEIGGFWKSFDDAGQPQCIFGIYEHKGVFYGRIIGSYDDDGKLSDNIYHPEGRSAGVVGNPHTCGLDIIYNLLDNGGSYDGKIIDPSKGKTYNCKLWREGVNLIIRGKLFIFGKNFTWHPAVKDDFPKDFKMPDMSKFTPKVPQLY